MSDTLDIRAEIIKLARLLDAEPQQIAFLEGAGTESLRAFRRELMDRFYGDAGGLSRFAKAGNLLPSSVIASLTKEAVGPVLAARIAGMVDPRQAVAVVSKLPVSFVADIAVEIDPRRIEAVLGRLPESTIAKLATELTARREYVTLGQFIGFLDERTLLASMEQASDADMLQTAFVAEEKAPLSGVVAMMTDKRLQGIMKAAAREDLWPEAIDLLRHMDDEQYARLVNLAAKLDAKSLDAMLHSAQHDDIWEAVLPALSAMDKPRNAVAAILRADGATIKGFVDAIVADDLWNETRELLAKLDVDQLTELRKRIAKNGRQSAFEPVAELLAA